MITNIFQNVKLSCPITGNPQPLIEWTKNGETIDFTWTRYKTNTKKGFLKILKPLDSDLDSGVFICKGINGFGTEQVQIELIVKGIFLFINPQWFLIIKNSSSSKFLSVELLYFPIKDEFGHMPERRRIGIDDKSLAMSSNKFLRPPIFTPDTKSSPERYIARIGDKFSVFCEAIGNPTPSIIWFKDNMPVDRIVHSEG